MDRRQPAGMDAETAALFPERLEHRDDSLVPEGRKSSCVGDVVETVGGETPSTKEPRYWDGGERSWATPKDLSGLAAPIPLETARRITDAGLEKIGSGLLPRDTLLPKLLAGELRVPEVEGAV